MLRAALRQAAKWVDSAPRRGKWPRAAFVLQTNALHEDPLVSPSLAPDGAGMNVINVTSV